MHFIAGTYNYHSSWFFVYVRLVPPVVAEYAPFVLFSLLPQENSLKSSVEPPSTWSGGSIYPLKPFWFFLFALYYQTCPGVQEVRCIPVAHFRVAACLSFKASPGAQPFKWKWVAYSYLNQTHFPYNSWATRLTSKPRQTATRKWPISIESLSKWHFWATDGTQKRRFRMPGHLSPQKFQTNHLF